MRLPAGLWATRDPVAMVSGIRSSGEALPRSLGAGGLTAMGVGAIIGTGIFVVIGEGAALAGPSVVLAFLVAAVACLFSALSYAELAAAVPVSGSAYTYTYATMGELVAFVIGWDLVLEYGVAMAAVAVGWAGNLNAFLDAAFGVSLPAALSSPPGDGGVFNVPAMAVVLAVTGLLVAGTRESARVTAVMVVVKLAVLAFFVVVALTAFDPANLTPFAPAGAAGVTSAAAVIFFAYIGFDAVATGAEESRDPGRDLPVAIVGSLAVATVVYVLVAVAAVGVVPVATMAGSDAPLAVALDEGAGIDWAAAVLAFGALAAITSVLVMMAYGQTRILFAMCRDRLLPPALAVLHPRLGTPARLTVALGLVVGVLAALVPLSEVVKLVNIGTLFAFLVVNLGVLLLRRTRPDMARPFRAPLAPLTPLLGAGMCVWLMSDLPASTWLRFAAWLALGVVAYAAYGFRHSRMREPR